MDHLQTRPVSLSLSRIPAGTVQPIDEPLRSQFKDGAVGVIQKLLLQEHKLVWNSLARTW